MSPTLLTEGAFRYRFYARDLAHHPHDPHVHVVKSESEHAKFGLNPVRLVYSKRVKGRELRAVQRVVEANEGFFLEEWYEYFS